MRAAGEVLASLLLGAVCAWSVGCGHDEEPTVKFYQVGTANGFPPVHITGDASALAITSAGGGNGVSRASVSNSSGTQYFADNPNYPDGDFTVEPGEGFNSMKLYCDEGGAGKWKPITAEQLGL